MAATLELFTLENLASTEKDHQEILLSSISKKEQGAIHCHSELHSVKFLLFTYR